MAYQKITDMTATAIDEYTPSEFKEKNVYTQILSSVTTELQKIEDSLWDMYTRRGLSTAAGAQLEAIGSLLNVPRTVGDSDDKYRLEIYAQILIRRADTTADAIMQAMQAIFGVETSRLYEHYSGCMTGGIAIRVIAQEPVKGASKILNNISAATIGSAVVLRDVNNGLAWTPVEVVTNELYLTDEDNNKFITEGAQNITVTTKSGDTEENLIGSLADAGVKQYDLAVEVDANTGKLLVNKNSVDGLFKVERQATLGGLYGYFAEVEQFARGSSIIEGE